jgi:diadenosine tetraphosphate (Ap4A) HIT family hydrolase
VTHAVSPTVFRCRGYRFFFFSREEPRMHVHVLAERGEAKFWLEPRMELAKNDRVSAANLREIEQIIEARLDEPKRAWHAHFER